MNIDDLIPQEDITSFGLERARKYAIQRAQRGWDDTIPWELDEYLCQMMPQWLAAIKEDDTKIPASIEQEDGAALEAWHAILDTMIEGFQAGAKIFTITAEDYHMQAKYIAKLDEALELLREYFLDLWT